MMPKVPIILLVEQKFLYLVKTCLLVLLINTKILFIRGFARIILLSLCASHGPEKAKLSQTVIKHCACQIDQKHKTQIR